MSFRVTLALSTLGTALAAAWIVACRSPEPAPEPAPAPVHVTPTIARSKEEYFARGRADVERNARIQRDERTARNVVLFVGDGMGVTTITAARIRAGEKSGRHEAEELSFETFPHLAHSKTYQANQQVPDSAPTMTAMVTGCKTNDGMLSVAPEVQGLDFASALLPGNRLTTILESAEERGLWTGVVTTARVTHATPGACYAHTPRAITNATPTWTTAGRSARKPRFARETQTSPTSRDSSWSSPCTRRR